MSIISRIREFIWRILGIDYNHILKTVDYIYLKEDKYTSLGHKSYSNNAVVFRWSNAPIKIGKYCAIAEGVRFIVDEGKHRSNCVTSYPFAKNNVGDRKGITIGNDVWIGQNSIILPGVNIGNGVTVGAGSVVTKDLHDYCIYGGVPCELIKRKCEVPEAELLNKIAWWNWPDEMVDKYYENLTGPIDQFIELFK